MELVFYLNREFVKASEAKVSIYDHGFLYGDGVFETIRIYKNKIFQFDQHLERLFYGLKKLEIKVPLNKEVILKTAKMLINMNGLEDGALRVVVTRGEGEFGLSRSLCSQPSILISVSPIKCKLEKLHEQGVACSVVSVRKPPAQAIPADIKSLSMLNNILAKAEAKKNDSFEGIILNMEGYVAEGATSNIFCISEGRLVTPDLSCGVLKGITRGIVMNLAQSMGLEVWEGFLTVNEIYNSAECFLTSTLIEIMPVISLDGRKIGKGKAGEITKALTEKFRGVVKKQVSEEKTDLHKILSRG